MRPWMSSTVSPKRLLQSLVALLGGGEIDAFGFLDQRTDPIDAAAVVERALDRVDHFAEPFERQRAGVDLLPAGGLFAQLGNVHVAEIGQHQRARDRRRGEHQKIDRFAFARQREPLVHAEAVLLVDDGEREIVKRHVVLKQRVGADDEIDIAGGERRQNLRAFAAALAAGEDGEADAGGRRQPRDGGEMLPRQNFGRRHERRLPAGLDHGRGGKERDHGLAGADVAMKQPQHAVRLREIGDDVVDRALLRRRERIGQRGDDPGAQQPLGGAAAAGARAHMAAQQCERELAGEQFVVGEPRPRRARTARGRPGSPGDARLRSASAKLGKSLRLSQAASCHSGKSGRRSSASIDRLAQLVRMQPLGERIDRIDQRQLGKSGRIDHAVGMHHLQMAVVERRDARNVADLALGKELLQIILARVEIGDGQRVGVVAGVDIVGRARPVRRRRPVAIDGDGDRHHGIGRDRGELWLIAAVDEAGRQMKQKIDDARRLAVAADQAREQLLQLRPDAGQRRERREQRIEHWGAHLILGNRR